MLDIKYIRENLEQIKMAAKNKNVKVDLDELLKIDDQRKDLMTQIDNLRAQRNELAKENQKGKPSEETIAKGKDIKDKIAALEETLNKVSEDYEEIMVKVPTVPALDVPVGHDENENVEIEKYGEPTKFSFTPKSHVELGKSLDIIDFDRGVKVSGYRGYYMKNEGVSLQMALMMYALEKLIQKGFTPMIPPTLVKEFVLFGSGYFSGRKYNGEVDEIYKIDNKEKEADGQLNKDDKFLIGTAEPSLLAYYSGETLNEKDLPIKFCGFSPCYRSEIGSYGKDTKGLYRVHEFMKVEQVCLCAADIETANRMHLDMLNISKELHAEIGLPYRVLKICTGDMSAGKYKMFDMEAWIPSRNGYGETGSASNFVDWQSRRLDVRYKDKDGNKKFVYMINNTAIPSPRFIIAILENFQQEDGSVVVPEVLRKYMPGNLSSIRVKE